jgi:dTDP-4-dehydrorhamnose 3,5-epimerase
LPTFFCVTSYIADFSYKCAEYYHPEDDAGIRWNDPAIGIAWPVGAPLLSAKDETAPLLKDADLD